MVLGGIKESQKKDSTEISELAKNSPLAGSFQIWSRMWGQFLILAVSSIFTLLNKDHRDHKVDTQGHMEVNMAHSREDMYNNTDLLRARKHRLEAYKEHNMDHKDKVDMEDRGTLLRERSKE
ncbi:hypothetical protein NQ318_002111 [Aromia moschata]|uniref:Uncharacterized protein n=1 Tax=Aromia moschata TaxID=1265417 RepID=A0AAV8Y7M5_9CUCU|nr:hypothetical protein NQ318_002111 [Aromia moschata]